MTNVITTTQDTTLERPVLVVALSGWVDAGSAGERAAQYLETHLDDPAELAHVDLSDLSDLQTVRPTLSLVDGSNREVDWPRITFRSGRAGEPGSDVIVCRGPEPSLRWGRLAAETVELAERHGARLVVTLAGMPSLVSHHRPVRVLSTASARSLAQEVEPNRPDYEGPTGAQTVVQVAAGRAGIPAVGLWAEVPHYLARTVSPLASRALLRRLRELAGVEVGLRSLDRQVGVYRREVEETVAQRSDLARLVEGLDERQDDLPTGDELASEIEEFLRDEG